MAGKLQDLKDDFDDSSEDTTKWPNSFSSSATRAETGGDLVITLANGIAGSNYSSYRSATSGWDLTSSYVLVKVPTMCNVATSAQAYLQMFPDADNNIETTQFGGTLYFRKKVATVVATVASVAYNASTHLWWRIREVSGTTYWDTSSDGVNWTNQTSLANPITLTALTVDIGAGTFQSETDPGTVHYDNFNMPIGSEFGNAYRHVEVGNGMSRNEGAT